MTATLKRPENVSWLDHEKDILPIMTAIFVDGLGQGHSESLSRTIPGKASSTNPGNTRIFRLPYGTDRSISSCRRNHFAYSTSGCQADAVKLHKPSFERKRTLLRPLIIGMSHHFNNLLMGIWGNASLIRMQLGADDSRYPRVEKMENLIQSGAFLIHMVLGYLGERRTVAKQIRLNQLISEIKVETRTDSEDEDPWNFEARLKWASRIQRPRMIAGSTARVIEILFQGIEHYCEEMLSEQRNNDVIHKKLTIIRSLVTRGLEIACKLRLYAGDYSEGMKRRVPIGAIVKRNMQRFEEQYPNIETECRIRGVLPMLEADELHLEWALVEVLTNCVNAMPNGGKMKVTVQTLQDESPQVRCGVQRGGNYIVITVEDSGDGMPESIKSRIFEPFFTNSQTRGKVGLGLAAADGIIRNHNGYIHFQTGPGNGSVFKIYLPISGTAIQDRELKKMIRIRTDRPSLSAALP